ncbi:glycosyltransferase family 39 protein [Pseudonocardia sp. RS11V-5]|uniref:ArnT family glycosyltransferase n=1 Tax=Pseudonocardia terrae TaxID=2905831 RepID=UPI001E5ED10E|nr:glycosyltransferase family 39 protein [Pseudonocardia terrae]MCE3555475.1 glycosyltransferase family 39 protein [Pseudonocardia terrae]
MARLTWWVLAIAAVVIALSIARAFAPMTAYPGDIWRQSDTATIARNFAANGMNIFFPQINWGGAGPGYVEAEFQLMPWLTALTYLVFGEHIVLGRLISLAFMLLAAAAFWGLARRLLPATAARWALAAFLLSPAFMRWGTAFMPEATVLAFYLLALLGFCRWLQEDRPILLVWAAAATSAAALVKPTSLHIGLVIGLWVAFIARDRLRRPSLYVAGVAALVAPVLWLRHAAGLHATYGNTFGVISGGDSKWGSLSLWLSPAFYLGNFRTETIFIYGLVGLPLAVLGVLWLWRRRSSRRATSEASAGAWSAGVSPLPLLGAGAIALTLYYFAAGRYTSTDLGIQYHVYSLPYAAMAVGAGIVVALGWARARLNGPATVGAGAVLAVLLGAQGVNVFAQSLQDRAGVFGSCAIALDAVSTPSDLAVVSTTSRTVEDGVTNNYQEPIVFFLADRKGWSLPADRHTPEEVARLRAAGARFLVVGDRQLVPTGGPLAAWLADNASQLRSIEQDGCGVWDLVAVAE